MTTEQIFELAFACGFSKETLMDKSMYDFDAWISTPEELLKFARAIYSEGFSDGCKEGSYSDYTWMRP